MSVLEQRMRAAGERRAARAVAALVSRVADRLRDVPGVTVEEQGDGVTVSAAGLHLRWLEEARLRDVAGWLR